ncbi:MAG: nicotinate (nicotinamide) nucleotide adenylyltransferase, partial [Chloroflexi bacterium]|nr:nicotinate (nicotinamide) nucleotide adenylyltransferase [Chloroflexota bacterium]
MKAVGVFGGSFDPVHNGHLAIALAALESIPLDRVLFVPARRSPLKDEAPAGSEADRLAMLELATRDEPRFAVSRIELERPAPSYTVQTLEALAGQGRLFLILGADAAADLPRWRDPERVRRLATLVVARRPRSQHEDRAAILLDTPLMDVSARELRARAARGRSRRYLVPNAVRRH